MNIQSILNSIDQVPKGHKHRKAWLVGGFFFGYTTELVWMVWACRSWCKCRWQLESHSRCNCWWNQGQIAILYIQFLPLTSSIASALVESGSQILYFQIQHKYPAGIYTRNLETLCNIYQTQTCNTRAALASLLTNRLTKQLIVF